MLIGEYRVGGSWIEGGESEGRDYEFTYGTYE